MSASNEIDPQKLRNHLRNVYAAMGVTLVVYSAGGCSHLAEWPVQAGIWSIVTSFVLSLVMIVWPVSPDTRLTRLTLLQIFAFLSGLNTGPLLQMTIDIDPQIVLTSAISTAVIFVCFSIAALLARDDLYLYLFGVFFACLLWVLILTILFLIFQNPLLFEIRSYLGVLTMCGLILVDTQLIIARCKDGDLDYVRDTISLFLDVIMLFEFILELLGYRRVVRRNNAA